MEKKFIIQYQENPDSITQEVDIQTALTAAMKTVDVPFTIIPPDLVNPKAGNPFDVSNLWVNDKPIRSFKDVPKFLGQGTYAADYPMEDLVQWVDESISEEGLELNPDFQRGHVWSQRQQQEYIEFLLHGGKTGRDLYFNRPSWHNPVPEGAYDDYVCVDGLQRLTAMQKFIKNELRVFGLLYREFDGKMRMSQDFIRIHINDLKSKKEVLVWYLQMNAGGTPHTSKELSKVAEMLQNI